MCASTTMVSCRTHTWRFMASSSNTSTTTIANKLICCCKLMDFPNKLSSETFFFWICMAWVVNVAQPSSLLSRWKSGPSRLSIKMGFSTNKSLDQMKQMWKSSHSGELTGWCERQQINGEGKLWHSVQLWWQEANNNDSGCVAVGCIWNETKWSTTTKKLWLLLNLSSTGVVKQLTQCVKCSLLLSFWISLGPDKVMWGPFFAVCFQHHVLSNTKASHLLLCSSIARWLCVCDPHFLIHQLQRCFVCIAWKFYQLAQMGLSLWLFVVILGDSFFGCRFWVTNHAVVGFCATCRTFPWARNLGFLAILNAKSSVLPSQSWQKMRMQWVRQTAMP